MTSFGSSSARDDSKAKTALEYANQAEKLGYQHTDVHNEESIASEAVVAKFVTGQDPVIETANGGRLPTVPVDEALKLNSLRDRMQGKDPASRPLPKSSVREAKDGSLHGFVRSRSRKNAPATTSDLPEAPLPNAIPPSKTNPLFPPLPAYGPPSLLRDLQCYFFRLSSFMLSLCFLLVVVLGSAFTSIPLMMRHILIRLKFQNPDTRRPFHEVELKRKLKRREAEQVWDGQNNRKRRRLSGSDHQEDGEGQDNRFPPREGGPDPLVCDAGYYARRVGLDMEEFDVQTEDGFTIQLLHVYDPKEYEPAPPPMRRQNSARVFREHVMDNGRVQGSCGSQYKDGERKYPVLLMHGLLQSAGAFCCTEDDSLAFVLAKAGFDVWLGNNRCGFEPRHNLLKYNDPRMWAWNIRQMGVFDLTALISRTLEETGFEKVGLVCHSQGTTQTFVALAKEQRPDIGPKISVFCALAPAVYAGPLIQKFYFKIMRVISPGMFRLIFGIHSFIPFMMKMHKVLPSRLYGAMGYRVFSFLFGWTDERWELDLRDRLFQFAPTFVSAESMRWWLGREAFATQKCILSTRAEGQLEDEEDEEEDDYFNLKPNSQTTADLSCHCDGHYHQEHGRYAWYDERAPPFAFWIAGNDDLVDGRRLLRRIERGREPHIDLVQAKVIDEYAHLDVIWAMDSVEKVSKEVAEVLWRTAPEDARRVCRTPAGCEETASSLGVSPSNSNVNDFTRQGHINLGKENVPLKTSLK